MDTREPLHVLLTSAGRRGYLVNSFRQALGEGGRVFAADASDDAPALWIADVSFRLPPFTDPCYLDHLLALCERHRVKLLVPLNDYELPLIAAHRQRFLAVGTIPHVSTPEVVASCLDKWQTYRFLCDSGLPTPPTYVSVAEARAALEEGVIDFPLVIKPRWGSGSQGIELARDERELDLILDLAGRRAAQAEVVVSCLDKWQTYHFPCDSGLPTPPTYVSVAEARGPGGGGDRLPARHQTAVGERLAGARARA